MKKFLSLALAMVMVLSLFTMTTVASAEDFTDDDSITYQEAIDVISAIKVVDGYADGSFKPGDNLTRGAAAKIITNMILGPTASSALSTKTAPFKDVPANHTFAGQIAYCAEQGIINGYGDDTFHPGNALSGYAFLKMLLGALGYKGEVEGFTGANWSINVAKLASGIGMMNDLQGDFSGTDAVNRETACLFAFNTLSCDLVVYNQLLVGSGNTVTNQGNVATSKYWNSQSSFVNGQNIVNDNIVQFGEEYFSRLVRNQGNFTWWDNWDANYNTDSMGRPASSWTYRGEDIGTYTKVADKSYTGNVALNTIYTDLGMNTGTNSADHGTATIIINGIPYRSSVSGNNLTVNGTGRVTVKRNTSEKVGDFTKGYDWWLQNGGAGGTLVSADKTVTIKDSQTNYEWTITVPGLSTTVSDSWVGSADPTDALEKDLIKENKVGNGTKIEVFRNDKTNDVIIAVMSVYGGKISAVKDGTSKRDDYVEIEYGSNRYHRPVGMTSGDSSTTATNWFSTTGFKVNDVVAYTYSDKDNEIVTMQAIEAVEGSLTKRTVGKNLTLGDTTYKYSNEYNFEFGLSENDLTNKSNYRIFQDEDGNALWIEEAAFNLMDYALIERISCEKEDIARHDVISHTIDDIIDNGYWTGTTFTADSDWATQPVAPWNDSTNVNSIWDGNRAKLLFADGTEKTVTLDKSYVTSNTKTRYGINKAVPTAGSDNLEFWAGDIVRVTNLSNGTVRLNAVTELDIKSINTATESTNAWFFSAHDGTKSSTWNQPNTVGFMTIKDRQVSVDTGSGKKTINADSQTVFVVRVKDSDNRQAWKVYTGIKNAPTIEEGVGFAYMKSNLAKIIFITDGTAKNVSKDVTFIALDSVSKTVTESDTNQYYTYQAVVRGEITSLDIAWNASISNLVGGNFTSGDDETAGRLPGAIANNYISDTDALIATLSFDSSASTAAYAYGIKTVSDTEIRLGTTDASGNELRGMVLPVADSVKVFFITDGGDIEAAEFEDITTSYNRIVYYTLDDGEVTNLFICETDKRD